MRAAPFLIGALEESDRDKEALRHAAAEALGKLGDARAASVLIRLASDQSSEIRRSAVRSLGRLGLATSSDVLVRALNDRSDWVRAEAAKALGGLRIEKAKESLYPNQAH